MINSIVYLIIILVGFIISCISIILFNKKFNIMPFEHLIYSLILFLLNFLVFSKLIYLIVDYKILNIYNLFSDNVLLKLNFLFSGYSFIGGIIGTIILIPFMAKIFKINKINLFLLYIPNLVGLYGILKIGCFVKGCCAGINNFPCSLIESFLNVLLYIYILTLIKKNRVKEEIIGKSLIFFGLNRFVISFFRQYISIYTFIFVEIVCLYLILLGINIRKTKRLIY